MNCSNTIRTAIVIAILSLAAAGAFGAEVMGTSRGHDLDALWAQAQKTFDITTHDAVLLLESRHETINENGGRRTLVHRVVWIGTPPGMRAHADLRVPWFQGASAEDLARGQVVAARVEGQPDSCRRDTSRRSRNGG